MTGMEAAARGRLRLPKGGWYGVSSIAGGTFLLVTTEFLPIGLLSAIADSLAVSTGHAGLAISIPGLVAAVCAPAIPLLARGLDRRILLLGLTSLILASNIISLLAPAFELFLFSRVLLGIGVGGLWTFAVASGRRLVPEASGGRATAIISAAIGVGTVVGVPAGALIGELAGWRAAFAINAGVAGLVLLSQVAFLPSLPARKAMDIGSLLAASRVPMLRAGLIASAFIACGHFAAYTFLEPFLRQLPRFSEYTLAAVLLGYAGAGIFGAFAGEFVAKRSIKAAFAGSAGFAGIAILLATALGTFPLAAIILVLSWGFAFGAVPVSNQIWTYHAAPDLFEGSSALMVSVFQIALAAGAALGGVLTDHAGVRAAFLAGGLLSLGCTLILATFGGSQRTTGDADIEAT